MLTSLKNVNKYLMILTFKKVKPPKKGPILKVLTLILKSLALFPAKTKTHSFLNLRSKFSKAEKLQTLLSKQPFRITM